jgi:NADPH2:quinone reductase
VTEASTIPLAALTASLALYSILGLPPPWSPTETENPVLIYGGSSAVGAFAIKLARISNLHPIITVAGAGGNYVSSLLDASKGDVLIDYRRGPEAVKSEIQTNLLGRRKLEFAFDAISEKGSSKICAAVLTEGGKLAHTLPLEAGVELSEHTTASLVMSGDIHGSFGEHQEQREFGSKMMRLFGRGLEEGWFSGHPYEVVPGGLDAVERILQDLKAEKASAKKFVFRISDTEGLEGRASMASFT